MALDLLEAYPDIFALLHPHDELRHLETVRGDDGLLRVRFARRVDGVQVWGEDLVVHLDGRGELLAFNGVYSATPPGWLPRRSPRVRRRLWNWQEVTPDVHLDR